LYTGYGEDGAKSVKKNVDKNKNINKKISPKAPIALNFTK
jgi:hypothetical protein